MNRPPTRFTRYLRAAAVVMVTHPEQRPGQAFVNTLWHDDRFRAHAPASLQAGSALDPYHHDDRVPAFLAALLVSWVPDHA